MHLFGLTGGIASGKSAVAARFRARGVPVLDADALAREVVAKGSPGLAAVVDAFGAEALTATGEMDRKRIADIVFHDPAARARLNGILHPRIGALTSSGLGGSRSRVTRRRSSWRTEWSRCSVRSWWSPLPKTYRWRGAPRATA
jgi:dephospho-CoA kinase